uniref:Uncharacterized protein n=1 Tax=Arundo donax TaxID=35708 RepID=A0A0A9D5T1_ARUDO
MITYIIHFLLLPQTNTRPFNNRRRNNNNSNYTTQCSADCLCPPGPVLLSFTTDSTFPFKVCSSLSLAISARRLASSAIWLCSTDAAFSRPGPALSSPCSVRCSCAQGPSRLASFPPKIFPVCKRYLPVDDKVPGFPTQAIPHCKFYRIQEKVDHDVVHPNSTCPAPTNTPDARKLPVHNRS